MKLLPVDEWLIEFNPDCILVAAHENYDCLYWTRLTLADFPNRTSHPSSDFSKHLVGLSDLKAVFTELVNNSSVAQPQATPDRVAR
jgi:hypothetical protein